MELRLFTLFDVAVGTYLKPFWSDHKANAIRSFQQLVNQKDDPNNMVSQHPDQFVLFELGYFDYLTGVFHNNANPLSLGNGVEYKSVS